jgi:hypothetical protein
MLANGFYLPILPLWQKSIIILNRSLFRGEDPAPDRVDDFTSKVDPYNLLFIYLKNLQMLTSSSPQP